MPLTEEQKRQFLIRAGYDPSKYRVVEDPIPPRQLPAQAEVEQMGAWEAGGRTAARAAIPAATGLLTYAGVSSALAPFTGGMSIPIGLLASLPATYLAGQGQEKVLQKLQSPESYQAGIEKLRQARIDQPVASFAGEFLPYAAAFRPSLGGYRALGNLARGQALGSGGKAALATMGAGAGINTAVEGGMQYMTGEEFNPTRLGLAALAGGTFTSPYPYLSRMAPRAFPQQTLEVSPDLNPPITDPLDIFAASRPAVTAAIDPADVFAGHKAVSEINAGIPRRKSLQERLQESQKPKPPGKIKPQVVKPTVSDIELKVQDIVAENQPRPPEAGVAPEGTVGGKVRPEYRLPDKPTTSQGLPEQSRSTEQANVKKNLGLPDEPPTEVIPPVGTTGIEKAEYILGNIPKQKPITKNQARIINREELQRSLNEGQIPPKDTVPATYRDIEPAVKLSDGTIITTPGAKSHYQLKDPRIDTDTGADFGFLVKGKYIPREKMQEAFVKGGNPEVVSMTTMDEAIQAGKIKPDDTLELHTGISGSVVTKALSNLADLVSPIVKKVAKGTGVTGANASKYLEEFFTQYSRNIGRYTNRANDITRGVENPENFTRYLWEMQHMKSSSVPLSAADKSRADALRTYFKDVHADQRALGIDVKTGSGGFRRAIDDPNYYPGIIDQAVASKLSTNRTTPEAKALMQDYKDFVQRTHGLTPAEADEALKLRIKGFSTDVKTDAATYNAIRRAEGYGIPWSWMEKNPRKLLNRYSRRVARDFAFFKTVEKNPEARAVFDVPDQYGSRDLNPKAFATGEAIESLEGNPYFDHATGLMKGQIEDQALTTETVNRVIRSGFLGPLTGARDLATTYGQLAPYLQIGDTPALVGAIKNIQKGWKDSFRTGVNRENINDIEFARVTSDIQSLHDNAITMANFLQRIQGRDMMEKFTRAYVMSIGEIVARANFGRALKGDKQARGFLEQFGKRVENLNEKISKSSYTDEDLQEVAASLVERVQGTYDPRGQTMWATKGWWSPFFSLARWNLEKAHVVIEDVIKPMNRGDFKPFLKYTLGVMGVSAPLIKLINEQLGGKKQQIATLDESLKEGDLQDQAHSVIAMMQLAAYGGFMADIAKMYVDMAEKRLPNTPNVPVLDIFEQTIQDIGFARDAITAGENPVKIAGLFFEDIFLKNIQAYRAIANQSWDADKVKRANEFRDYQTYRRLKDLPTTSAEGRRSNPFTSPSQRYKRAESLSEARNIFREEILPSVRQLAASDPFQARQRLDALKQIPDSTFPAQAPIARDFLRFLENTQGSAASQTRLKEAQRRRALNRQKSKMVP